MIQYLPMGGFKLLTKDEISSLDRSEYHENSKEGLILEVELEYPQELHDLHNEYPLAPDKLLVTREMLSPYCRELKSKFKLSHNKCHKLIPNLRKKEKYILRYRNLQVYTVTGFGLKVKNVHRALRFHQSPWLKQYID